MTWQPSAGRASASVVPLRGDWAQRRPAQTALAAPEADSWAVAAGLQIVAERLCEWVDLRAGEAVLDVGSGGGAALVAARHFAAATALEPAGHAASGTARRHAAAERLPLAWEVGDLAGLPFPDGRFDLALSCFGATRAEDPAGAARELLRVVRPGGRIGLANWTPEGFPGELLRLLERHAAAPRTALERWGTRDGMRELFRHREVAATVQICHFRYRSPVHWLSVFRDGHAPTRRAFAVLDARAQAALAEDLLALVHRWNRGGDGTVILPGAYLEAMVTCR